MANCMLLLHVNNLLLALLILSLASQVSWHFRLHVGDEVSINRLLRGKKSRPHSAKRHKRRFKWLGRHGCTHTFSSSDTDDSWQTQSRASEFYETQGAKWLKQWIWNQVIVCFYAILMWHVDHVFHQPGLLPSYSEWISHRTARKRDAMRLQAVDMEGEIKISSNCNATYASGENARWINVDKLENKRAKKNKKSWWDERDVAPLHVSTSSVVRTWIYFWNALLHLQSLVNAF